MPRRSGKRRRAHHLFTFEFDGRQYHFSCNTISYKQIVRCDASYRLLPGEKPRTEIASAINQNMREISLDILRDATHLPPVLRLEKLNKYAFNTPNDGGSGAQYRGLITFDLANMLAAPIPFVVHDSILLKNIDKPVFSEIVRVYEKQKEHGKQVFLAYDTLASYDAGAQRILEKNAVLRLSPAGNELFGWAWNKEEKNDADETS